MDNHELITDLVGRLKKSCLELGQQVEEEKESVSPANCTFELIEKGFACLQISNDLFQIVARNISLSCTGDAQTNGSSPEAAPTRFPEHVLKMLLTNVADMEGMLICRHVCMEWQQVIEDTPQLMRKIIFPVWHPKPFLDLEVVRRKKVRAISFKNALDLKCKYIEAFAAYISNNVEEVHLDFDTQLVNVYQSHLFKFVLEKCKKLEVLKFKSKYYEEYVLQKMFNKIEPEIVIPCQQKLRCFVMNATKFTFENARQLSSLLARFPFLEEINAEGCLVADATLQLLIGIQNYIKKYASSLKLKRLYLEPATTECYSSKLVHAEMLSLIYLCGKHLVVWQPPPLLDLNMLLDIPHAVQSPRAMWLNTFVEAILVYCEETKMDMFEFSGICIQKLLLIFRRSILKEDLLWLKTNNDFESLQMETRMPYKFRQERLPVEVFKKIFTIGFPSLKLLVINGQVFDPIDGFPWSQCFPCLEKISISLYDSTPNDFIGQLTSLELLTHVTLRYFDNLRDIAFTDLHQNKFLGDDSTYFEPAISCFRKLQYLELTHCNKLTDDTVYEGILHCQTLKELVIFECDGISKAVKVMAEGIVKARNLV